MIWHWVNRHAKRPAVLAALRRIARRRDPAARERALIAASGLFDESYYLIQAPDVHEAGGDAIDHFCGHGWREGRRPNACFDPAWYRELYLADAPEANPLVHYIRKGEAAGCRPIAFFDPAWYCRAYGLDVVAAGAAALSREPPLAAGRAQCGLRSRVLSGAPSRRDRAQPRSLRASHSLRGRARSRSLGALRFARLPGRQHGRAAAGAADTGDPRTAGAARALSRRAGPRDGGAMNRIAGLEALCQPTRASAGRASAGRCQRGTGEPARAMRR